MPLRLEIAAPGAAPREVPLLPGRTEVVAAAREQYRLVGDAGGIPADVRVLRVENDMVVTGLPDGQELALRDFFRACRPGSDCTLSLAVAGAPEVVVGNDSPSLAALTDGSFLLYGPVEPGTAPVAYGGGEAGAMSPWAIGLAALLGVGVVAGAGGGGGGGDDGSTAVLGAADAVPPASGAPAGAAPTPPAGSAPTPAPVPPAAPSDTTAPTLRIVDSVAQPTTNAPVVFTFTFDEAVSGFDASDVTVTGGTRGAFVAGADGRSWTLEVTPAAGVASGEIAVSVAEGAAIDSAGNRVAATRAAQGIDTQGPTLTIADDTPAAVTGGPVTFTFSLSEPAAGFDASDVRVSGGTAGALVAAGDGRTWSMTVAPAAGVQSGQVAVEVAAGAATDALGNRSAAASAAQPIDTRGPTVSIVDDTPAAVTGRPVTFTFSMSEPTAGFTADDVLVRGGVAGPLVTLAEGLRYAVTVTPPPNVASDTISVSVREGGASDGLGNLNAATPPVTQGIDTVAPTQQVFLFAVADNLAPRTGNLVTGETTNDRTPTVTLTLDSVLGAGETLALLRDGAVVAAVGSGAGFTFTDSGVPPGPHAYTASVSDAAGNLRVLDLNGPLPDTGFTFLVT